MHGEAEGILKGELAGLIFCIVNRREWGITLPMVNNAIRSHNWSSSKQPSYFTDGLLKGTSAPADKTGLKGAIPKAGAHIHMTAGDTLSFTLHSVEVLGPLIAANGHQERLCDPIWQCWLMHVHYVAAYHFTFNSLID